MVHPFTTHRYHDLVVCSESGRTPTSCSCGFMRWHLANPEFPRFREGKHAVYDALKVNGPPKLSVLATDAVALRDFLASLSARARLVGPGEPRE
jgi:hypothetical protein